MTINKLYSMTVDTHKVSHVVLTDIIMTPNTTSPDLSISLLSTCKTGERLSHMKCLHLRLIKNLRATSHIWMATSLLLVPIRQAINLTVQKIHSQITTTTTRAILHKATVIAQHLSEIENEVTRTGPLLRTQKRKQDARKTTSRRNSNDDSLK